MDDEAATVNARSTRWPVAGGGIRARSPKTRCVGSPADRASARAAARAAGHAAATAHVAGHTRHSATYAVTAATYAAAPTDADAATAKERDWQYRHLLDLEETP
ncbi:MAG TPA: hypothetical protein VGP70_24570 [Actinomadura sp.]|nr:hypothetical protein [Actinomadura sp.]